MDPGRSQRLLKLCEAHDVDVDELNHLVTLGRAAGLVPHDLAHDPGEESLELNFKPTNLSRYVKTSGRVENIILLTVTFYSSSPLVIDALGR